MTEITIADFRYNGPDVARGYKTDSPSHAWFIEIGGGDILVTNTKIR